MLMYLLCKAALIVVLGPFEGVAFVLNNLLGVVWVADNTDRFSQIAAHGGIVASTSPLHVFFSSMGVANNFIPVREYFLFILPIQLQVLAAIYALSFVRVLLRFVPTITAG